MHPMTSGNINCRKNKDGLSADSRKLSRSGITKYDNAALVNKVVVFAGTNHRGFFVLKGRLALYGSIKGAYRSWARSLFLFSSISSHSRTFSGSAVKYYHQSYIRF